MNANVVRDDSLGKATVKIGSLQPNEWCRLVERLEQGGSGTLELDVFFKPNSHYHLNFQLEQAKEEEKKCLAEAARLSREVQMAEHARRWLANVDENTKMPLSLEERDWVRACGGRNLVAPAWITVTQTQVEALVRARQQAHPISLFPEVELSSASLKLKVRMIGGFGLTSSARRICTYCTCEIPQKRESSVSTDLAEGLNPERAPEFDAMVPCQNAQALSRQKPHCLGGDAAEPFQVQMPEVASSLSVYQRCLCLNLQGYSPGDALVLHVFCLDPQGASAAQQLHATCVLDL
ncbi:MCTP1 [Symbiodinium sp. CCMP2456]|nr:MCTP1 [Symbiodinium sp. CCMP2456]